MAEVDRLWMGGEEPLDIFFVAKCPFVWWDVVVIFTPISALVELYPRESGIVFLAPGVGLFELEPTVAIRYLTYAGVES